MVNVLGMTIVETTSSPAEIGAQLLTSTDDELLPDSSVSLRPPINRQNGEENAKIRKSRKSHTDDRSTENGSSTKMQITTSSPMTRSQSRKTFN